MPANPHFRRVRIILGDQLNPCHSWFNETNPDTLYIIAELISETQYTRHHLQKITAFFMAMADFADEASAAEALEIARLAELEEEEAVKLQQQQQQQQKSHKEQFSDGVVVHHN